MKREHCSFNSLSSRQTMSGCWTMFRVSCSLIEHLILSIYGKLWHDVPRSHFPPPLHKMAEPRRSQEGHILHFYHTCSFIHSTDSFMRISVVLLYNLLTMSLLPVCPLASDGGGAAPVSVRLSTGPGCQLPAGDPRPLCLLWHPGAA